MNRLPKKIIRHYKTGDIIKKTSKVIFKPLILKPQLYFKNISNRKKYGPSAPKHGDLIRVNPKNVNKALMFLGGLTKSEASGRVVESSKWFEKATLITEIPDDSFSDDGIAIKVRCCIEHWVYGVPWSDTGIYQFIDKKKSKANIDQIIERYEILDLIFQQVQQEGKLRLKSESDEDLSWKWFSLKHNRIGKKKDKEALIHFGPDGELFLGGSCHRFAIARILGLPFPARIGLVHESAIPYLDYYRYPHSNG